MSQQGGASLMAAGDFVARGKIAFLYGNIVNYYTF
jgi:hypothetical protein